MFEFYSEITERQFPLTIEECKEKDEVATQLKQRGEELTKSALGISALIIIAGLILGFMLGNVLDSFGIGLIIFLIIAGIGFNVYTLYYTISLILAAKASEVQSLKIMSNLMLYNESKNTIAKKSEQKPSNSEAGYSLSQLAREKTETDDRWICKYCEKKNPQSTVYCTDCGKYK